MTTTTIADEVRDIASQIAADVPVYVTRMHWKRTDEVTTDDLRSFDREMRIAEKRAFHDLAGYDSESLEAAIQYPDDGLLVREDFLIDRVLRIRRIVAMSRDERIQTLVMNAIIYCGPERVGYSHEEFEAARALLPLELRRQHREGWGGDIEQAAAWLDRFDPGVDD